MSTGPGATVSTGPGAAVSTGPGVARADVPVGVVLAAGLGTRLRPLTDLRPKALCPVGERSLLEHALARLAPCTDRVAVNAHHHAAALVEAVGKQATVSVEAAPLGSAGALGRLRHWVDGQPVLVTNADAFLLDEQARPAGLDDFVAGWDGQRPRCLVADVGGAGPLGGWEYVGATLLPWTVVRDLPDAFGGLYDAVWGPALAAGRLDLVPVRGAWVDCGTPSDYLRANLLLSDGQSVLGAGATVLGRVTRCVVWPGAVVGPAEDLVEVVRAGPADDPVTVPAAQA